MGEIETEYRPFLEDGAQASFEAARVAILPVPYEGTVSYGRGAARGPAAILAASEQLELHDDELDAEPHRAGIWTAPPLDPGGADPDRLFERIVARHDELSQAAKWVMMLGGEHSITPPAVASAARRHPGLSVVQLDAHADLRESYQGQRGSHCCAIQRCLEHVGRVHALGIRSYSAAEAERIRAGIPGYSILPACEMTDPAATARALDGLEGRPVYLTVDVDYFDPSLIPSTGTPEPGGPGWYPTLALLRSLFQRADVVGCDVVELAPIAKLHHPDFTVARLVHKLIGYRFSCGPSARSRGSSDAFRT